jgi:hypothetical protein
MNGVLVSVEGGKVEDIVKVMGKLCQDIVIRYRAFDEGNIWQVWNIEALSRQQIVNNDDFPR